jgi:hypothetical protein
MTAPENFILRWVRLKRDSNTPRGAEVGGDAQRLSTVDASVGNAEATIAQPRIDAAADEPFDLASLPSIDAITVDTDIRAFLQSRVPAELARTALRRAWASDPAIRDFIGIAENQWDFNDPNAIPGFGPLRETDKLPALLADALGGRDRLAQMASETLEPVAQASSAVTGREPPEVDQNVQQTFRGSGSVRPSAPDSSNRDVEPNAPPKGGLTAEANDGSVNRRSHGGALPR